MAKVLIKESDLRKLTDVYKFLTGVGGDCRWEDVSACFGDQGLTIDSAGNVTAVRVRSLAARKLTPGCLSGTLSELLLPEVDGVAKGTSSAVQCVSADILGACYMPKLDSLADVFGGSTGATFRRRPVLGAWTVLESMNGCRFHLADGETGFDWLSQATSVADRALYYGALYFRYAGDVRPRMEFPNATSVGKSAFYNFKVAQRDGPDGGRTYRAADVFLPKVETIAAKTATDTTDVFGLGPLSANIGVAAHPEWAEYGVLYLTGPNPGDMQRTEAEVKAMPDYPWGITRVTAAEAAQGKGVRIAHSTNPDGSYNYFTVTRGS